MGIFGSVSSKQVDEFAKSLARELAQRCPPAPVDGSAGDKQRKLVSTLDEICNKALQYRIEHKLGIYKKARLGNTFRWELTELGFDKRFAEDATQRLIVRIARKA